jgi:hypothetical protein
VKAIPLAIAALAYSVTTAAADALPSSNEGPVGKSIVDFLTSVATPV